MKYTFRNCTLEDFDFLFKLKKENFKWYVDKIWGWKDDDQKERLKQDLKEHLNHKRIILVDDKPVGIYAVHTTQDGDLFINEISILKEYQNKGLEAKVLNKIKDNISTVKISSKDSKSRKFYQEHGFIKDKITKEEVILRKDEDNEN